MCFQDDILMGTLSVRENLLFSANLRLNSQHHSSTDKNSRVNDIIQDLGLTDCAHTKVQCYLHNLHITHYKVSVGKNTAKSYSMLKTVTLLISYSGIRRSAYLKNYFSKCRK